VMISRAGIWGGNLPLGHAETYSVIIEDRIASRDGIVHEAVILRLDGGIPVALPSMSF
jgi:hypothetical protein